MAEGEILSLIDRFYDAALDGSTWGEPLDDLAHLFNGIGTSVLRLSGDPPLFGVSESLRETAEAYVSGWWRKDTILNVGLKIGVGRGVHAAADFVPAEIRAKDEFFQDFLRPAGSSGSLIAITGPYEGTLVSFNVQRKIGFEHVDAAERDRFALIARHLSRAVAMSMRLATAEAIGRSLASRLGDFDCAVAVVGRDGRLLVSNAAFDALRHEGIEVRHGRVLLARADMQPALQRMIRCALDGSLGDTGPDTLAVPRPHSLLPLLIRAVPVTPERAERHIGAIPARGVMLMVLNPSHSAYPSLTTALRALGLTPAQARVALAIGSGQSPRETAETLQIREATVRTTLKHLYSRLGIDRQSQLARLVSRAIPFSS